MRDYNPYSFIDLYKYLAAAVIAFLFHFHDHFLHFLSLPNPFSGNILTHFLSVQGWACTELFFLLSGMMFIHAYQDRLKEKTITFSGFMKKRIKRLLPMIILTSVSAYILELIYFLTGIESWSGSIDPLPLLWNITLGGGAVFHTKVYLNEPIWYIGVLLFCYCIGVLMVYLQKNRKNPLPFLIPVFAGICIFHLEKEYPLLNIRTARGLTGFFLGCFLEEIFCRITEKSAGEKRKLVIISLAFLFTGLAVLAANYLVNPFLISNMYVFYDVFIFMPVIMLSGLCRPLNRLCSHRFLKSAGRISYGMYLWNFVIYSGINLVLRMSPENLVLAEEEILMIWLISVVLHHVLAVVSTRFLDRFA